MTIDSTATRSRRWLLFAGLGALGAAVGHVRALVAGARR